MAPALDIRSFLATRSGLIVLALSALVLLGTTFAAGLLQPVALAEKLSYADMSIVAMSLPGVIILQIIGVLMVAGEWSDRSIQFTFLQRPGRGRVLASRLLAVLLVGSLLVAVGIASAFAATALGGALGEGAVYEDSRRIAIAISLHLLMLLAGAVAMGLLTQSTVLGLITALGVPMLVSTVAAFTGAFGSETLQSIVAAVDLQAASSRITAGEGTWSDAIPVVLLIIVPGLIGARRWMTRDVA